MARATGLERVGAILLITFCILFAFGLQILSVHTSHIRKRNKAQREKLVKRLGLSGDGKSWNIAAFFHPYCNAGGGGERVLWQAVSHLLRTEPDLIAVVYTGDVGEEQSLDIPISSAVKRRGERDNAGVSDDYSESTKKEVLEKCNERFAIPLHEQYFSSRIHFLPLYSRHLVSDHYWKRLTLLGQSWGSMRLAWEACNQILPDIWLDTMGYAFTYPIIRLFKLSMPIGAYVHYPTISTDMLQRVRDREVGHTNDSSVSGSKMRSNIKLIYYNLFAMAYAWSLRRASVLVANGSWTCTHLNNLVIGPSSKLPSSDPKRPQIVYPPCDTASLSVFPLHERKRATIVSLAQFRPEKEHSTQLRAVKEAIEKRPALRQNLRLICMGSCRNEGDERRIEELKKLSKELKIEDLVSFVVNAPYGEVLSNISSASIGLSTMIDEHFGINVVEFMAAGLITLSHASAGPMLDIAVEVDGKPTGFHARSLNDFAEMIIQITSMDEREAVSLRQRARKRALDTFNSKAFEQAWDEKLWARLARSLRRPPSEKKVQ